MKKLGIGLLVCGIFVLVLAIYFSFSFSYIKEYRGILDTTLYIPKASFLESFKKEEEEYPIYYENGRKTSNLEPLRINKVVFKTIKGEETIKENMDSILHKKYTSFLCNNEKDIYYDKEHDVTILDYAILDKGIFTSYEINYIRGVINTSDCSVIKNKAFVEYGYDLSYKSPYDVREFDTLFYDYLHKDGKRYNVYTDCLDCLNIKSGIGVMYSFRYMLEASFIDMSLLLGKLEEDVGEATTKKTVYDKGVMYKNKVFSLFMCNNNIVYIGKDLEYDSKKYCDR